jgi:hypothetical protein
MVARLLLQGADDAVYRHAIEKENVLQCRTIASAIRLARLIRRRLENFDAELWQMVASGPKPLAVQCLFAAAVKHSTLLRDFIDLALRDEIRLLHTHINPGIWWSFLDDCAGRDPAVAQWSEATKTRLRSTVFQILAQAGWLSDTKGLALQKVNILPELSTYLSSRGEIALLKTIEMR